MVARSVGRREKLIARSTAMATASALTTAHTPPTADSVVAE
jgi:hypothetical protein